MKTYKTNTNAKGNTAIAPEKIIPGNMYAITINPYLQPPKIDKVSLLVWYRKFYDELCAHKDSMELTLYMESSQTARFHYHGTIVIYNIFNYLNFIRYLDDTSHFEIDTIGHCDCPTRNHIEGCTGSYNWSKYITKGELIFRPLLTPSTIGYPLKITKVSQRIEKKTIPVNHFLAPKTTKITKKKKDLSFFLLSESDQEPVANAVRDNRVEDDSW